MTAEKQRGKGDAGIVKHFGRMNHAGLFLFVWPFQQYTFNPTPLYIRLKLLIHWEYKTARLTPIPVRRCAYPRFRGKGTLIITPRLA